MTQKVNLNSIYKPSEDVVARDVQGEFVIIPITSGIGDSDDAIFSLNKFGMAIWEKLNSKTSLKEVTRALALQFEGDAKKIGNDVLGLVEELLKRNMVVACSKK